MYHKVPQDYVRLQGNSYKYGLFLEARNLTKKRLQQSFLWIFQNS